MKDSQIYQLLEHWADVVDPRVVDLLKALLKSCAELVNVPWCLGVLEGLN